MAKSIDGGVVVVNTLSVKNDGKYELVKGESVSYKNEKNEDGTFKSLEQKIEEIASSSDANFASEKDIKDMMDELFGSSGN